MHACLARQIYSGHIMQLTYLHMVPCRSLPPLTTSESAVSWMLACKSMRCVLIMWLCLHAVRSSSGELGRAACPPDEICRLLRPSSKFTSRAGRTEHQLQH